MFLPVTDLLIQRGVGVFETIGTWQKRPLMLTQHLERLLKSAESFRIRPPLSLDTMRNVVREGIERLGGEVQIRVFLTGGDLFDRIEQAFTQARFFALFEPLELPPSKAYDEGVTLEPVNESRDNPSVKSINYRRSYVMTQKDAFEMLYCPEGEITEGSHSSFFLVQDGKLVTAPLSRVLKGTTRQAVLELARGAGIEIEERCPRLDELDLAEEAFITGSVKKILPVTRIGAQLIGDGHPGPVTKHLLELYLKHIVNWME